MSYYTIAPHHLYGHRAPSPPTHLHSASLYGPRHPTPPHHAPPPHPYQAPEYDLDEEERLAVAHLRYIRQKREAQQAALERESAALRAKEERDNAIRRAVAEKRIAEAAAALKRQREREIQAAVERERERVRSAILEQRQRQEDRARQQYQAQVQAAQQHHARQLQVDQARVAQAKQCAAKVAQRATQQVAKEVKKEYKDEYEVLNSLLGSLFGISLEGEKEVFKADIKPTPVPTPTPAPVDARPPTPTAPARTESTPFPEDINELLSQYLGLRIEPTTSEAKPTPASESSPKPTNTTPHGLNDFLSRYGLVFEPLDVSEEVKALDTPKVPTPVEVAPTVADPPEPTLPTLASFSTPTPPTQQAGHDHPLTNYFSNMVELPPFLREILGHAEVAYNQQQDGKKEEVVEGKGKGVAEGERNVPAVTAPTQIAEPTPTSIAEPIPTPAPVESNPEPTPEVDETAKALSTLSTISSDLTLVRDSFDFPSTLAFATPSPDTTNPPALLFNKVNSGYHAQTHKLLQLLLAADAINSNGNKDVRRKRKEIVREVEQEIENLEKRRDEMWEQVKAAREAGVVHDHEDGSSCASSSVDPSEVKEEVEHVEHAEEGFNAGPFESDPIPSSSDTPDGVAEESNKVEVKEEDKKARVEEDEGYEVL